jgi:NADH-quinone oxidoreductase subunit G
MESVAQEPVLSISERGDRAFVDIDPAVPLDHAWAGNVVDLCPVGSLVSKDFLHKARAWDLDKTASVCTGCSQGCNVMIDTRDEVVVRLRPRPNLEVNHHFICDTGRLDYRWMNRGDRIEHAEGPAGRSTWDEACRAVGDLIETARGPVVVVVGRRIATEGIGWTMRLLSDRTTRATMQVPTGPEAPLAGIPNLALRSERAPNRVGGLLFGVDGDWEATLAAIDADTLVLVLDAELTDDEAAQVATGRVIHCATTPDPRLGAVWRLPITTMAEATGTYVNRDGRAQRFLPARTPPGMARPAWWVAASIWAARAVDRAVPATAAEAFSALPELGGLSHRDLGFGGRMVPVMEAAR